MSDDAGLILGNVRTEGGQVRASFMRGDEVTWFDLQPEFAAHFAYALLNAAEPSVWARIRGVWRNRRGDG